MIDLGRIYKPEVTPVHQIDFSVACVLTLTEAEVGAVLAGEKRAFIPAGKLLATRNATADAKIHHEVESGCKLTGTFSGVLAHDVLVQAGVLDYNVGVMVKGVAYRDVVASANGGTIANAAELEAQGLKFYNVKTEK